MKFINHRVATCIFKSFTKYDYVKWDTPIEFSVIYNTVRRNLKFEIGYIGTESEAHRILAEDY